MKKLKQAVLILLTIVMLGPGIASANSSYLPGEFTVCVQKKTLERQSLYPNLEIDEIDEAQFRSRCEKEILAKHKDSQFCSTHEVYDTRSCLKRYAEITSDSKPLLENLNLPLEQCEEAYGRSVIEGDDCVYELVEPHDPSLFCNTFKSSEVSKECEALDTFGYREQFDALGIESKRQCDGLLLTELRKNCNYHFHYSPPGYSVILFIVLALLVLGLRIALRGSSWVAKTVLEGALFTLGLVAYQLFAVLKTTGAFYESRLLLWLNPISLLNANICNPGKLVFEDLVSHGIYFFISITLVVLISKRITKKYFWVFLIVYVVAVFAFSMLLAIGSLGCS